jgi:hypothetical protein
MPEPVTKMRKRPKAQPRVAGEKVPAVVGTVVMAALDKVRPNGWNPNRLTPFEKQALTYGLQTDGWLPSHAMTIWGKDAEGHVLNIIVDGEHRWHAGKELGLTEGPMVFIDGLTEAQAKALTVKLDAKRGRFDEDKLALVLRSIVADLDAETRALNLGIVEDDIVKYLRIEPEGGVIGELPTGQAAHVKQVQLAFTPQRYEEFQRMAKELAVKFGKKNLTDTVLEAVRRASASTAAK